MTRPLLPIVACAVLRLPKSAQAPQAGPIQSKPAPCQQSAFPTAATERRKHFAACARLGTPKRYGARPR
ncbi:hypothetical protein PF002_g29664 [Phytophthora fragariae]|uniref:Uncharacterized protein n=1 Tax=Phytophthora fragariae TaxID=53985 RepID=A0A6A3PNV0_9STRA|nr:hypothetical protein PF003_g11659 [Phytophthora fragariae]KAE8964817.1 hypothetical protein PF011_g28528 [Phytophthora fragariae]KAE9064295.1 hypothetical protein PF007_g29249 [Phytophthora fragariae]KAE9172049.1 hypothetical protein PF002_g29664 [Phytophthora fragariae]